MISHKRRESFKTEKYIPDVISEISGKFQTAYKEKQTGHASAVMDEPYPYGESKSQMTMQVSQLSSRGLKKNLFSVKKDKTREKRKYINPSIHSEVLD
jgi:hypothetical protein